MPYATRAKSEDGETHRTHIHDTRGACVASGEEPQRDGIGEKEGEREQRREGGWTQSGAQSRA